MGDNVVSVIVLVPAGDTPSRRALERVVVDHMAVGGNQHLSQTDDRIEVEEPHIQFARLEQPVTQPGLVADAIETVLVLS